MNEFSFEYILNFKLDLNGIKCKICQYSSTLSHRKALCAVLLYQMTQINVSLFKMNYSQVLKQNAPFTWRTIIRTVGNAIIVHRFMSRLMFITAIGVMTSNKYGLDFRS